MKRALACAAAAAVVTGCASRPEKIAPVYISEAAYRPWTCDELGRERGRVSTALSEMSRRQRVTRNLDAAGYVLFLLPMASITGNGRAADIARLKGEQEAIERAAQRNQCTAAAPPTQSTAEGEAPTPSN